MCALTWGDPSTFSIVLDRADILCRFSVLVEKVKWLIQNNHTTMTAIFRRPTRLLSILSSIFILYIFIISIPKNPDPVFTFEYVKSSYDWSSLPQRYPVDKITPLPTGKTPKLPKVQYNFASDKKPSKDRVAILSDRRTAVKDAFLKSWNNYKEHAWMYDELESLCRVRQRTLSAGGLLPWWIPWTRCG